jgi:hypothetical protein
VLEVWPVRYIVPDNVTVFKLTAVVDVEAVPDREPWKVVAVRTLFPMVIPEPVDNWVLPEAVFNAVPTKYLVAVDASVLIRAAEVAVPLKVVAVNNPETLLNEIPDPTN